MIHPHTYIHPNARPATNVKIDPFTVIHQDVVIGDGTWIGSNVTIMEGARIGKNCRIFPGAVIAAVPQDLKFENEVTSIIIISFITQIFVYMLRLIRDIDEPFEYSPTGKERAADVDLFPLVEYDKRAKGRL